MLANWMVWEMGLGSPMNVKNGGDIVQLGEEEQAEPISREMRPGG